MNVLTNINMNQLQILNRIEQLLSSDPGSPIEGQFWYRSDLHAVKYRDNSANRTVAILTNTLDQFGAPAANVSWNSQKITNLLDPTSAQDAATKNYVDNTTQGLSTKPTAQVATTGALAANSYSNGTSGVGATLTATSNGAIAAIDGYTPLLNDILLIKNESTLTHNGLYVVSQVGDGSNPYILTRHTSMDDSSEFDGAFVPISNQSTTYTNSFFLFNYISGFVTGTNNVTFSQVTSATSLSGSSSITISGGVVSVNATWVGAASLTTVGTLVSGALGSGFTSVAIAQGGTSQTTAANARGTSGIGAATSAPTSATNTTATAAGIPTKITGTLTGTGAATVFTFNDNLGTLNKVAQVQDSSGNVVITDVQYTSNTTVITFASAVANATTYNVVIVG